jgi:hypothetical protein
MKWWIWLLVGLFVFGGTLIIAKIMYKKERGNADSLEKARAAKAAKDATAKVEINPEAVAS